MCGKVLLELKRYQRSSVLHIRSNTEKHHDHMMTCVSVKKTFKQTQTCKKDHPQKTNKEKKNPPTTTLSLYRLIINNAT